MSTVELRTLLADAGRAGAYFVDEHDRDGLVEAATALGFAVAPIELGDCRDKDAVLARLAAALRFPDWFGGNWDALADSLGDLSWHPAAGYLLLIEHARAWREADGDGFATAMAILNEAAADWAGRDVPFWALLPWPSTGLQEMAS